jgi:uncharacterized protein (TIGR03067 family)
MRAFLLIAALAVAVPDRPNPTPQHVQPSPQEQLIGDWRFVSHEKDVEPPANAPAQIFRILATESVWIEQGAPMEENGFTGKITIDGTKNPIAIDLISKNGRYTLRGIIRLDGDRMTMAWSYTNNRPTDFTGYPDVHYFRRVKK